MNEPNFFRGPGSDARRPVKPKPPERFSLRWWLLKLRHPLSGTLPLVDMLRGAASAKEMTKREAVVDLFVEAAKVRPEESAMQDDVSRYIARQARWSEKTFGPGIRTEGLRDHIEKELDEAEATPWDVFEYVDLAILSLDGAQRLCRAAGLNPLQTGFAVSQALERKARRNAKREWPDWRTAEPGKAIEHVRSGNEKAAGSTLSESWAMWTEAKQTLRAVESLIRVMHREELNAGKGNRHETERIRSLFSVRRRLYRLFPEFTSCEKMNAGENIDEAQAESTDVCENCARTRAEHL